MYTLMLISYTDTSFSEYTHLIKVPSHNMNISCQGLEVVIALFGTQIACA